MSSSKCHPCQVDNNNETAKFIFSVPFCKNYSERDGRFIKKNIHLEIPRKLREKDIMLVNHEGDSLDNIILYKHHNI